MDYILSIQDVEIGNYIIILLCLRTVVLRHTGVRQSLSGMDVSLAYKDTILILL
jgi:hypothetical protein